MSRLAGAAAAALALAVASPIVSPASAETLAGLGSSDADQVRAWVTRSRDNAGLPFVIIDKAQAKVSVFAGDGRPLGSAPALLGMAFGDSTVTGIGDRELARIKPQERTTPAGRFVSALGKDYDGKEVLWVDNAAAVSLHRVVTSNAKERRLQRLATASPLDNRISFGCINVPVAFFDTVIRPAFLGAYGIVYILPEQKSLAETFAGFRTQIPAQAATEAGANAAF